MPKTIKIDDDSHNQLVRVKEEMQASGIDTTTFSDAIRWLIMRDALHECEMQRRSET